MSGHLTVRQPSSRSKGIWWKPQSTHTFAKDFVLETDANIERLGAVLSQVQDDGKVNPVAYASRALSPAERNYAVTELETSAVV